VEFVDGGPTRRSASTYAACRGVLFPGEEDFGIVPLEAIACGKPVIAYARGGALETVVEREGLRTGILFHETVCRGADRGMKRCRETHFDGHAMRRFALRFDRDVSRKRCGNTSNAGGGSSAPSPPSVCERTAYRIPQLTLAADLPILDRPRIFRNGDGPGGDARRRRAVPVV